MDTATPGDNVLTAAEVHGAQPLSEGGSENDGGIADVVLAPPELTPDGVVDTLRDLIAHSLHAGQLRPGDRLPSIRELRQQMGVSKHVVTTAYDRLAQEGWVEKRERSGVYVAVQGVGDRQGLGETANWLSDVLVQAWTHRIKVPRLPEVVRRYSGTATLRCACIDSDRDTLLELRTELEQHFGLTCETVDADGLPPLPAAGEPVDGRRFPAAMREADLLVTTAYHAPVVRAAAEALSKPCVVTTANPEHVRVVESRARVGEVVVLCEDPRYGKRVRALVGAACRDAIRVVLAGDAAALAQLDLSQPVLLTRGAHERLGRSDLRLLVPFAPPFSRECAQELTRWVIRLNQAVERR